MERNFRFLRCPDCGKRGVRHYMRPREEDGYSCRYCDFDAFTLSRATLDLERRERLRAANTDRSDEVL